MSAPSPGTGPAPNGDSDPDESALHALFLAAAADVVGARLAREVFSIARERPRRTAAGLSPPAPRTPAADFACHAPVTIFRRLLARATRDEAPRSAPEVDGVHDRDAETAPPPNRERAGDRLEEGDVRVFADDPDDPDDSTTETRASAIRVVSVSSYGTVRSRAYATAEALADAIVEAADPAALGAVVADVRVAARADVGAADSAEDSAERRESRDTKRDATRPDERNPHSNPNHPNPRRRRPSRLGGEIRVVTAARLRDARAADLLLCRACGAFLRGDKGLREHSQVRHGASYEASLERVADARNAIVMFRRGEDERPPRRSGSDADRPGDAAAPSEGRPTRRARDGLPLGLRLARDGRLEALRAHVAETGWDPTSASAVDANGSCALHWAAGRGRLATCAYLVDALGEDPARAQKKDGRAAVHWAARNGRLKTLRWLSRTCGVSVNAPTRDGTTPFMWCVWGGGGSDEPEDGEETANATNATNDDDDDDEKNLAGTLRWLVFDAKCDVHATNAFGCNASQWAAQRAVGSVAMCAYLRDVGVDLTVTNRNGHSAVHKAAVKGNSAACEWLLGAGGLGLEHLRADGDGNTPGEMARLEGHEALAAWLAEKTRTLEEARSAEMS